MRWRHFYAKLQTLSNSNLFSDFGHIKKSNHLEFIFNYKEIFGLQLEFRGT